MKKTREEFLQAMKSQKFGVEVELTGITIQKVYDLLTEYFEGNIFDSKGRCWNVVYDSSIKAYENHNNVYIPTNSTDYKAELVTPILDYEDIPMLQEVISIIHKAGGVSDTKYGTGIHIHVSDDGHNQDTLRNLIRLMSSKQYLLERALDIPLSRLFSYCQYVDDWLANRCKRKFKDMDVLESTWNNTSNRYSMLNLSSLFSNKGIELRCFNGSLNVEVIKAYIQFSLALCQSAKDLTRCNSIKPKNTDNDKYVMRTWLNRMYLTGEEFKTCRKFMCRNLTGESSFSNPYARKNVFL